mmetsp:Transcript_29657/g.87960  ORF Transcript_29657/g.87960 Transcript_29657/m.87960 type:complete len:341 (+) Transcript_29657:120-1142(+)
MVPCNKILRCLSKERQRRHKASRSILILFKLLQFAPCIPQFILCILQGLLEHLDHVLCHIRPPRFLRGPAPDVAEVFLRAYEVGPQLFRPVRRPPIIPQVPLLLQPIGRPVRDGGLHRVARSEDRPEGPPPVVREPTQTHKVLLLLLLLLAGRIRRDAPPSQEPRQLLDGTGTDVPPVPEEELALLGSSRLGRAIDVLDERSEHIPGREFAVLVLEIVDPILTRDPRVLPGGGFGGGCGVDGRNRRGAGAEQSGQSRRAAAEGRRSHREMHEGKEGGEDVGPILDGDGVRGAVPANDVVRVDGKDGLARDVVHEVKVAVAVPIVVGVVAVALDGGPEPPD